MTLTRLSALLILLLLALPERVPAQERATGEGFQAGDRILLVVEEEPQLSDTFTVQPGPVLPLPGLGDISLVGVRRDELQAHLTRELGRFLKSPVVHARALIRIAILGEVGRPGVYPVPVDLVLADAVMLAGGATRDARLDALRIERGQTRLWAQDSLRHALAEGFTVDQLGLRAGDRIVVPRRGDADTVVRILGILAAAIYGVTRIF